VADPPSTQKPAQPSVDAAPRQINRGRLELRANTCEGAHSPPSPQFIGVATEIILFGRYKFTLF